jgi:hypothetical protein
MRSPNKDFGGKLGQLEAAAVAYELVVELSKLGKASENEKG